MNRLELIKTTTYRKIFMKTIIMKENGENPIDYLLEIIDDAYAEKELKMVANYLIGRWKSFNS